MSLLAKLFEQKYGKTAAAKTAAPATKTAVPVQGLPADVVRDFQGGKIAYAAFEDELKKLNDETVRELEKDAAAKDPFFQLLKRLG